MNKWDYIKFTSSYTAKEGKINKMERQLKEMEKISAKHIADKGLIYKTYKDSIYKVKNQTTKSYY